MAFELPEAVLIARQMMAVLAGKRISAVNLGEKSAGLVQQGFVSVPEEVLTGRRFGQVAARGKWITAALEPDLCLLVALESGGRVLYHAAGWFPPLRLGVRIDLEDRSALEVQVIGWGFVRVFPLRGRLQDAWTGQLGLSPLDEANFTQPALRGLLAAHAGKNLKAFFIDQHQIAGIGSGYLQDILYRARLHPQRLAGSLAASEQECLFRVVRETMHSALALDGRESEVDLFGVPGRYVPAMSGQLRGWPCPECGSPIEKLAVQGGAVYLCPACQQPPRGESFSLHSSFVRIR